jgi:hypothetical protein
LHRNGSNRASRKASQCRYCFDVCLNASPAATVGSGNS